MTTSQPRVVVAGIGNVYRGDDGVGPAIAARLVQMLPSSVLVLEGLDDPLELIEAWEGVELAVVVDAVVSTAKPGTVHTMEIAGPLPTMLRRLSTHLFSVAQVIELGTVLERMPERLVVVGVEAAEMGQGCVGLSVAVATAADQVVGDVRTLVAEHLGVARKEALDA